jgi:hypothetical protein
MEAFYFKFKLIIIIYGLLNFIMIMLLLFSAKREKPIWYSKNSLPRRIHKSHLSHDVLLRDIHNNKNIVAYYDYSNERWELTNYQMPPKEFIWRHIEIEYENISE